MYLNTDRVRNSNTLLKNAKKKSLTNIVRVLKHIYPGKTTTNKPNT